MPRPIPVPDEVSKPFWDACNQRRLVVQNCRSCKRLQFPPDKACAQCGSADNLEWKEVRGRGTIDNYIVIHDSRLAVYMEKQPYNVAVIRLEEDRAIQFFSNLPGTPPDQVPLGARVEAIYEEVSPEQLVLEWRVAH